MHSYKTGKQCRVVHTLRFCSAKLLVGGRPPIPRNSSMLELAARFSETLYRGPLAHEVAQADGAVKGQDKRALPAHDSSTGLCNVVAKEEKAHCVFLLANQINTALEARKCGHHFLAIFNYQRSFPAIRKGINKLCRSIFTGPKERFRTGNVKACFTCHCIYQLNIFKAWCPVYVHQI